MRSRAALAVMTARRSGCLASSFVTRLDRIAIMNSTQLTL
jgi:hypothetical protein